MHIVSLVQSALDAAVTQPITAPSKQQLHRERSKQFVESLASHLRSELDDEADVAVLSKHNDENRARFGLNELLYDILVCRTGTTQSASGGELLTYVTRGLWAIESEFARDSREALFDFNKLILSSSDNQLFIGPRVENELEFLQPLAAAAKCCSGNVYVALVPHPADWSTLSPLDVAGYAWENEEWKPVP
jgi:hypothetical protein